MMQQHLHVQGDNIRKVVGVSRVESSCALGKGK